MAVSERTEFDLELTPEELEGVRKVIAGSLANVNEPTAPYIYARFEDGQFVRVEDI